MRCHVETFSEETGRTPEQKLWMAVLETAVEDALTNKDPEEKEAARNWFRQGGSHFKLVCDLADFNPEYVRSRILTLLN